MERSELQSSNEKRQVFYLYAPFTLLTCLVEIASVERFQKTPLEYDASQTLQAKAKTLFESCIATILGKEERSNEWFLKQLFSFLVAVNRAQVPLVEPRKYTELLVRLCALDIIDHQSLKSAQKMVNWSVSPHLAALEQPAAIQDSEKINVNLMKFAIVLKSQSVLSKENILWIRQNISKFMIPIKESLFHDVSQVISILSSRTKCNTNLIVVQESPSSWFRKSSSKDDLNELNSVGLSLFMKRRQLKLENVESCLLASHCKYLIKSIPFGLVPSAIQEMLKKCIGTFNVIIGSESVTLDAVKHAFALIGLERTRFAIIQKLTTLGNAILVHSIKDPITPMNLARVIPVSDYSIPADPNQLASFTKEMDQWNSIWGLLLANPAVFMNFQSTPIAPIYANWQKSAEKHYSLLT